MIDQQKMNASPDTMHAEILNLIQKSKEYLEKKDAAGQQYADEAYKSAMQIKDKPLAIAAMRERLNYAMYMHSDYPTAEKLNWEYIELIDIDKDPTRAGSAYNIMGICNDIGGNYIGSHDWYIKTIDLLNKHRSSLQRDGFVLMGNVYCNLARLYKQLDETDERLIYVEKGQAAFEEADYADGLARVWNLRAGILPEDKPIEERLALFEKAYSYYTDGSDSVGRYTCLGNIGLCYCRIGKFTKGIALLEETVEGAKRTMSQALYGFSLFQLAEGLRLKGNLELALDFLTKAEDVIVKSNTVVHLGVIHKERAVLMAALGNYKEAYERMLQLLEHEDDRSDLDRHSAVEEARFKFELDKKEKEAELLRKQNKEIELFNEKLKQSNAELNQFAYVASHDLKEPLRMVSNYMQLLEKSFEGGLTKDQSTYIRYANEGAKRMYGLIDSLLGFARSTMDTELKQVDMNEAVDEVLRVILSSINRKVHIDSDELPVIEVDHTQMIQVLQNLISNSIKYNDQDEVIIHISYKYELGQHRFAVEDNGLGIEAQHREKVFDIFKRLHTRDSYSGTGIGLSICQKIVHRLNGRIWIEDSILGGTAVVFTIPAKETV